MHCYELLVYYDEPDGSGVSSMRMDVDSKRSTTGEALTELLESAYRGHSHMQFGSVAIRIDLICKLDLRELGPVN
jgi:hypothetical protein